MAEAEAQAEAEAESGDAQQDGKKADSTDITKGMFSSTAFAAELGVDGPKGKVKVKLNSKEILIGDEIAEQFENMVWPCRDVREMCTPDEFFSSKGFEQDKLDAWKKNYEAMLETWHITKDFNCVIMTFWQDRIIPICMESEKEVADLNAVAI